MVIQDIVWTAAESERALTALTLPSLQASCLEGFLLDAVAVHSSSAPLHTTSLLAISSHSYAMPGYLWAKPDNGRRSLSAFISYAPSLPTLHLTRGDGLGGAWWGGGRLYSHRAAARNDFTGCRLLLTVLLLPACSISIYRLRAAWRRGGLRAVSLCRMQRLTELPACVLKAALGGVLAGVMAAV